MTLLRLLFEHNLHTVKVGARKGVSYCHFIGAKAAVSGFGESISDALWDAVSRLPGGFA